jgi:transcriptional regulator with XRE-family HTH domain
MMGGILEVLEKSQELLIKNLRRLKSIHEETLEKASAGIGVSLRTYQKYLGGKVFPSKETISQIARHYGIAEADLFFDESTPPPAPLTVSDMTPEQLLATISKATQSETAEEAELLRLFRSADAPLRVAILETVRNLVAPDNSKR